MIKGTIVYAARDLLGFEATLIRHKHAEVCVEQWTRGVVTEPDSMGAIRVKWLVSPFKDIHGHYQPHMLRLSREDIAAEILVS